MIMQLPPRRENVLDTIKKLGFEVTEIVEKRKSRVKKFEINMDAKRDQKILLGLSYYSNNLLQNLVMDACIGKMLVRHMIVGGLQELRIAQIVQQSELIASILRNEYLLRDPRGFPETVYHRL